LAHGSVDQSVGDGKICRSIIRPVHAISAGLKYEKNVAALACKKATAHRGHTLRGWMQLQNYAPVLSVWLQYSSRRVILSPSTNCGDSDISFQNKVQWLCYAFTVQRFKERSLWSVTRASSWTNIHRLTFEIRQIGLLQEAGDVRKVNSSNTYPQPVNVRPYFYFRYRADHRQTCTAWANREMLSQCPASLVFRQMGSAWGWVFLKRNTKFCVVFCRHWVLTICSCFIISTLTVKQAYL